jgi:hypothetical protein
LKYKSIRKTVSSADATTIITDTDSGLDNLSLD